MYTRVFALAMALLCVAAASGSALGQEPPLMLQDFESEFPGPVSGFPGGWSFWGDGDETADLDVTQEITDQAAFSGVQSYQINYDTSLINSWNYFGMGGFLGFYTEDAGAAAGQPGEDNPANYRVSFDINIQGVVSGDEVVKGNITLYKADYEAVYGVDLNNDLDMDDGYNIWSSDFSTNMGEASGWVHVEWNLNAGTNPTVPNTDDVAYFTTPVFDDETTFSYGFFPKESEFGLDADNTINIDNFKFEFLAPIAVEGDFDIDGHVDGKDFLAWQRGESPMPNSLEDLSIWQNNFGGGGAIASAAATAPEPGGLLLAAIAAAKVLCGRRSSLT